MNLAIILTLYISGFAFFTYACIIADPRTSPVARFLVLRLPEAIVSGFRRLLGPKVMGALEAIAEYALVLVYLVIVLGCWSIMFTFGYDMVTESEHVSDAHKYIGYLVFLACMCSWRLATRTSPGVITARTIPKFDNYPYDDLLFVDKICPTVKIRKLARSKYDRISRQHIPRFDHFCGWINNPVGEENYRFFLLFLMVHVGMCTYGTVMMSLLFLGEIEDGDLLNATFFVVETGEEVKASKFVIFQFFFVRHFYVVAVFLVMSVMAVALSLFLGFHLYISARGMTTNEFYKWKEVRKWHKRAKEKHEEAKKAGVANDRATTSVTIGDEADVGCAGTTGAVDGAATEGPTGSSDKGEAAPDEKDDECNIGDPGPFPKNIYDRGVVENFQEIIYPRSTREDAMARWREFLRKGGGLTPSPAPAVEESDSKAVREKPKVI